MVIRNRRSGETESSSQDGTSRAEVTPSASDSAASPASGPQSPGTPPLPRPFLAPLEKDQTQPSLSGDGEPEPDPIRHGPAEKGTPSLLDRFHQSMGKLPVGMMTDTFLRVARIQSQRLTEYPTWLCATVTGSRIFITRLDEENLFRIIIGIIAGTIYWFFIRTLFEKSQDFSHLSTLEKEMSFRSEMGLYYSYFKTIIEAPSFGRGLWMILNDRLTEYPLVINSLKRFNLYPEVVLGICYRIYTTVMNSLGVQTKMCWTMKREEMLSSTEICTGFGDPASFYVELIFILNGVMMVTLCLYAMYLSDSKLGGVLTVAFYFSNHEDSTRVMWSPPLRENFSYPFFVLQMFLLTGILRTQNVNRTRLIPMFLSNVLFMLPWQFSQFILLTQVVSVFAVYLIGFIESCKLQKILYSHMASLVVCFVLMFGNTMLLTSYYAAFLVVCWVILAYPKYMDYLKVEGYNVPVWAIQGFSCLFGTVILWFLMCTIFGVSGDATVTSLIKAKLIGYTDVDFDTAFYICSAEFDFMAKETPERYIKTFLLPIVVFIFFIIAGMIYQVILHSRRNTERQENLCNQRELAYHAVQLIFFVALAVLIMRLKLFLTPHMCIMSSLIFSKQLFGWLFCKVPRGAIVFAIFTIVIIQGSANIKKGMDTFVKVNNLPQEELLLWIKENTKQGAVFAGEMTTMASVKLSAVRSIVNHPHYEDAGLRARTKIVYSMYSRKQAKDVKNDLSNLGVDYYILEDFWCLRKNKPGCSMSEIWEKEDSRHSRNDPLLCSRMRKDSKPFFKTVFKNKRFKILQISRE